MHHASKLRESMMRQQSLSAFKRDESKKSEMEELIKQLDTATSDILIGTDWNTNMAIVDALNTCRSQDVVREFVRQVRKKLQSRSLKTVSFALTLIETMVKNCGDRVHREVATQKFMSQMEKLARAHLQSSDRDALQVCDQSLDIIQAWGEAFLPKRNLFPLFVDTYHSLKAQGLPFRSAQYDENRAPIFTPEKNSSAATESRISESSPASNTGPTHEIQVMAESSLEMLTGIVKSAERRADLEQNDIAQEVVSTCRQNEAQLMLLIDECCQTNPEAIEGLFVSLEKLQKAMKLFEDACTGEVDLPILSSPETDTRKSPEPPAAEEESNIGGGSDLLGSNSPFASNNSFSVVPPPPASNSNKALPKLAPPPDRRMPKLAPSTRDLASRRGTSKKEKKVNITQQPAPEIDLLGGLDDEIFPTQTQTSQISTQQPDPFAAPDMFQTAPVTSHQDPFGNAPSANSAFGTVSHQQSTQPDPFNLATASSHSIPTVSNQDPFGNPTAADNAFEAVSHQQTAQPQPDLFDQAAIFNTAPIPSFPAQSDPFSSGVAPPTSLGPTDPFAAPITAPPPQPIQDANPFDMANVQGALPPPTDPFASAPSNPSNPIDQTNIVQNQYSTHNPAPQQKSASADPFSNIMNQFSTAPPNQTLPNQQQGSWQSSPVLNSSMPSIDDPFSSIMDPSANSTNSQQQDNFGGNPFG